MALCCLRNKAKLEKRFWNFSEQSIIRKILVCKSISVQTFGKFSQTEGQVVP